MSWQAKKGLRRNRVPGGLVGDESGRRLLQVSSGGEFTNLGVLRELEES